MSEKRRTVLKMLTAGGAWMAAASWDVARAQSRRTDVSETRKTEQPTIAASSDLQPLLAEIVRGFEAETQMKVRVTLGTARHFYAQILEGAPFELFLSSDEALVTQLVDTGRTEGRGDVYAIGRLAFYVPSESPLKADNFLGDIRPALRDGRLQRFAIADPEADSYGRLAEEALRRKLVWEEIQPLLAIGSDVTHAAQIAASGAVQGALVAYSQAGQLMVARGGKCSLVSDTLCAPLRERMVLLKNAGDTARRFYRYMLSDRVKTTLKRYGFLIPAG
ncbi:MAG: molybdate ABC transporter substrate-binding protein [Burkholderiales bacterium]|jgi:molybdate transport system substrate-binding protein|nr:molybdate ABC transporter substrate-binding protein [Burkholderiales bacterium]